MTGEDSVPASEADAVARDDYGAYDWQVFTRLNGRFRQRAMGRSSERSRCRDHIVQALSTMPAGVKAHGEIIRTNALDPTIFRLIEIAARERDGSISWLQI